MLKQDKYIEEKLTPLIEKLADTEHQRWADWQRYCHNIYYKGEFEDFTPRWQRQINTDYKDLSEQEKESDREQVRRYLPLIKETIKRIILDTIEEIEGVVNKEEISEEKNFSRTFVAGSETKRKLILKELNKLKE